MISKRIIVVDDEEMIVDLCSRVLAEQGYHVRGASSGEEALGLAAREKFDMAVTDMLMPGMDGLETVHALKKQQPELIGVLITGHGTMDTAIQAMERGLSGFIRKPFMPLELVHIVKDAFQKSALSVENTRLKTLMPLYRLGERFLASRSSEEILNGLIDEVSAQSETERVSVMLYDRDEGCLRIVASRGIKEEIAAKVRLKPGERIAGLVFEKGAPLVLNGGPDENPEFASFLESKEISASLSFPLKVRDTILGVMNVSRLRKESPFGNADLEMLRVIGGQAALALENLRVMDERAEKVRMRTILEQYMAPEVAEVLISHGTNLSSLGEIRDITVLFADIRNFTPLVQQVPLITLRSFLNDFFELLAEVVYRFKGTLDKFMGDAALAYFGAPISEEQADRSALMSAIAIHQGFEKLQRAWTAKEEKLSKIGLGIGISSGEVFLGNVGSKRRLDYTVIGMDVNIAQRLATEAASGEVLIAKRGNCSFSPEFPVLRESSRLLKGLDKPVAILSVATKG